MAREIYLTAEEARMAKEALEEAGFIVDAHADLLAHGVVYAVKSPKGEGWLLDAYEVRMIAHYGPDYFQEDRPLKLVGLAPYSEHLPGSAYRRYLERALANIFAEWRAGGIPGNRNNALNKAAYALGRLVGGGLISQEEAEALLKEEAEKVFQPGERREMEATIKSGLKAGEKRPLIPKSKNEGRKKRRGGGWIPPWREE